jgi:hypothetical protein
VSPNVIDPASTPPPCSGSVLDTARSRVDLPAPLPPSSVTTEPAGTSSETWRSAWTDRP